MEKEQIEFESKRIAKYFEKHWPNYANINFDKTFSLRNWATIMATIILHYNKNKYVFSSLEVDPLCKAYQKRSGGRPLRGMTDTFSGDVLDSKLLNTYKNKNNIKNNNGNNKKSINNNKNYDYGNKLKSIFKNKRILHIGCGYGYFLEVIKSLNAVPFGIEPYCSFPESLNITKARIEDLQDNNSELSRRLNNEKFDAIVAHDIFLFSIILNKENAHKIIKSLKKHLDKNGIMVFENINEETLLEKEEIEKLGFKAEYIDSIPNPYGRICSQIIINL